MDPEKNATEHVPSPKVQDANVMQEGTSAGSPRVIVTFAANDPENPYNWSKRKKLFIVFTATITLFNSTLASSLPSNAMAPMSAEFGISGGAEGGNPQLALPISLFLVGYIFGPLLFGPLSETHGRRRLIHVSFAGYTAFSLGCALAPGWASMLVFRLLTGVFASAPLAIGGGMMADIYSDPILRGRVLTYFLAANICAPVIAPTISGHVSEFSWRWTFWIGFIFAAVTWIPLALVPETFGPVILAKKAKNARRRAQKEGEACRQIYAPIELENKGWRNLVAVVLLRPLRMLFTELIVTASSLYIAMAYSVYFMYFQTYPIIFTGIYGMSNKTMSLMFLPIAAGILLALVMFILWDVYWRRAKAAGKQWAYKKEYSRLPLACAGGPLFVVSLFWLAWTARADVPWIVPCLAGVPFGTANLLITIALINYLGDSYGVFSASAIAAGSSCRNLIGAGLPLAAGPMYKALGVGWATSVFGFVSIFMCAVPFVFIRFGDEIRERSAFYQKLKAEIEMDANRVEM